MDTILLQIKDDKAYKLIEDLEALDIVRVIQRGHAPNSRKVLNSRTAEFRGALKLSKEKFNDFEKHAQEIRDEWRENI